MQGGASGSRRAPVPGDMGAETEKSVGGVGRCSLRRRVLRPHSPGALPASERRIWAFFHRERRCCEWVRSCTWAAEVASQSGSSVNAKAGKSITCQERKLAQLYQDNISGGHLSRSLVCYFRPVSTTSSGD